jgi:hypothetical protein
MDSLTRYHLATHQDGTWHVIDMMTGEPADTQMQDGSWRRLYRLARWEAELWSTSLNKTAGMAWRQTPL